MYVCMTGMEKRLMSSGSLESQLATHWRSYDWSDMDKIAIESGKACLIL